MFLILVKYTENWSWEMVPYQTVPYHQVWLYYQNNRYLSAILFLAFYLSLFNSLSELHFFLFQFYKRMNVVRAAAVAVIVRRIELAHCLTPWLQLSVLQHSTFVLTVEFFSVKMHEKKDFFCLHNQLFSWYKKLHK